MSDVIAIVSIICSAVVILISVYFNWKKVKLEEKIMNTNMMINVYPQILQWAMKSVPQFNGKLDDNLLKAWQKNIDNFVKEWQKKQSKKS